MHVQVMGGEKDHAREPSHKIEIKGRVIKNSAVCVSQPNPK